MKNNWRKVILSFWTLLSVVLLTAAVPLQSPLEEIPWWVWLVLISTILLIMFGIVLRFDWRSAGDQDKDKKK